MSRCSIGSIVIRFRLKVPCVSGGLLFFYTNPCPKKIKTAPGFTTEQTYHKKYWGHEFAFKAEGKAIAIAASQNDVIPTKAIKEKYMRLNQAVFDKAKS